METGEGTRLYSDLERTPKNTHIEHKIKVKLSSAC